MSRSRVALDLAAFLDSTHAGTVGDLAAAERRSAIERFLIAAYEHVGVAPHLLDGDGMTELLERVLPRSFGRKEPAARRLPELIGAYYDHLEEERTVAHAFEIRRALEDSAPAFEAALEASEAPTLVEPARTIENRAPKLGRNDPCWCGSGRKFKKCHGRPGAGSGQAG